MNALATVTLTCLLAAPIPKDAQKPPATIEGEWQLIELVRNGQPDNDPEIRTARFVIKGGQMAISSGGMKEEKATYTLNPKASPAEIDIRPGDGNNEKVVRGIYKFDKDRLTICFSKGDGDRPKEFKSEAGSSTTIFVLERVKK